MNNVSLKHSVPFCPPSHPSVYNLGTVQVQINILKDLRLFTQAALLLVALLQLWFAQKPTYKLDCLHSSSSTHRYCGQETAF